MCRFRALWLVPFIVSAGGAVHAQEAPAWPQLPPERTITVRFDPRLETEAVEIFVAPGTSTTVLLPQPIAGRG